MLTIRLISFIIMLMFTLLEARDSIVKQPHYQGHLDTKVVLQSENVDAKRIHQIIVVKEIKSNVVPIEKEGSNMRLNGRKLASKGGLKKELVGSERRSSKITGRNIHSSRMQSAETKHEGKKEEMAWLSNGRKQKGNKSVGTRNGNGRFQKLNTRDFEAANEEWTFMNRDYPGNGGGRHKPPTNNR
ncbi:uncharacterized protein [Spinacia oleracea]|uniref:Uncharacterized protein n=1 Tax=Spinacia oleracea TaxID=3562 RepID=A0A9R0ITM7_SPIOL|nr:uncharacterized protein LOC110794663 [Spinacia oleracea]